MSRTAHLTMLAMTTATLVAMTAIPRIASSQAAGTTLEAPQLRDMIKAMGYETKELNAEAGKEKYEFALERGNLNIPMSVELSSNKRNIWFVVYLGEVSRFKDFPALATQLLRENFTVQPTHFYVTKQDRLLVALALENRGPVDPPLLRRTFEKLADDVVKTSSVWQAHVISNDKGVRTQLPHP